MFDVKSNQSLINRGTVALKIMSLQVIFIVSLIAQVIVFLLSIKVSLFPSTDTLMNILSSFAEIIASLYGITMASYTFFLSRIDALTTTDSTLVFIAAYIKKRFKYLMWFVTFNVIVTLFTTLVLMYAPVPTQESSYFFYRLFCNEFVLSVASSILLILYYSILVINPNSIQKEAAKLKKRLSPGKSPDGDINAFITLYNRIVSICTDMIPKEVCNQIQQHKGTQFSYIIELLLENKPELLPLLIDIARIHRYYECTLNCKSLSVSQDMCSLAEKQLLRLEALTASDNTEITEKKKERTDPLSQDCFDMVLLKSAPKNKIVIQK